MHFDPGLMNRPGVDLIGGSQERVRPQPPVGQVQCREQRRGPVANGIEVQGNRIGTDKSGTIAVANGTGVLIQRSSGVTVGGTAAGAGNVIGGNAGQGVEITGAGTAGNVDVAVAVERDPPHGLGREGEEVG